MENSADNSADGLGILSPYQMADIKEGEKEQMLGFGITFIDGDKTVWTREMMEEVVQAAHEVVKRLNDELSSSEGGV